MYRFIFLLIPTLYLYSGFPYKPTHREKVDKFSFNTFMERYDKNYTTDEEFVKRWKIFINNIKTIRHHNSQNKTWKMSVNEFTDLTWEEFRQRLYPRNFNRNLLKSENLYSCKDNSTSLPSDFDWEKKGAVTPVKNQGHCGSCWTFSTTGAVEGAWFIKTGELVSVSEQEIVDCCNSQNGFSGNGCNGGEMDDAFMFVSRKGLCAEKSYPYTAKDGSCKENSCNSIVNITSYQDVTSMDENSLQHAVYKQPVSIAIEADHTSFQFYSSGVYSGDCGDNLDHGVLAVGWGVFNGEKYWKIKNSWGNSWGDNGYIKIARDISDPRGQCGIAMQPSYPVV